jgi:hypothetical protein
MRNAMSRTHLAVLLAAAVAGAGCSSFYVEAEQPSACIQLTSPQGLVIPGGTGTAGTMSATVNIGLNDAIPEFVFTGSPETSIVQFLGATVNLNNSASAGDVPSWLTNLRVTAQSPGVADVVLVDYTPTTAPTSATFSLAPRDRANNIVSLIRNGGVTLLLDVGYSATFPGGTWTAGVNACFSAKVKKTFQELING